MLKPDQICILSGEVHSGKTTFLRKLYRRWQSPQIKINGILSLAYFQNQNRLGYNGLTLPEEEEFPMLRIEINSPAQKVGRYYFLPHALAKAKKAILNFQGSNLTIIDEIGPAELQGRAYWVPLLKLLEKGQPVLLVIRQDLVSAFLDKMDTPALVVKLSSADPEAELQNWRLGQI